MQRMHLKLLCAALLALALCAGCPGGGDSQNGSPADPAPADAADRAGAAAPQDNNPQFDPALTLNEQYDLLKADRPESVKQLHEDQIRAIAATGIFNDAVVAETQAPRFVLPSTTGELISLDAELAQHPVVLVFFRGGW